MSESNCTRDWNHGLSASEHQAERHTSEWQFEGEKLFEVVLMSRAISKERSTELLDGAKNGKVHSLRLQLLMQPFQLLRQSWWRPYELPCQTSNKIRSSLHGLIFIVAINVRNTNIITDNSLD